MRQFLLLIVAIAFSQTTLANSIVGNWQGEVSHFVKNQFKEKKFSTVQITQNQNGTIEVYEGFFGDRITLTLQDGKLYNQDGQVGIFGNGYMSFHAFLFHDNQQNTDCYVLVSSFVNDLGQLDYFNKLTCNNGYFDDLSGILNR